MHLRSAFCSLGLLVSAALANAIPAKLARQAGSDGVDKIVVAHVIMGVTGGFSVQDWVSDIQLAQANGIDGFVLNVGSDQTSTIQSENAFQAAEQLSSNFKLFFSFDMSSFTCSTADDATVLRNLTLQFASRPNQFTVNGRAFVSTFAGESCTFGHTSDPDLVINVADGWRTEYTQHPDTVGKVHFVPSFFVDIARFSAFTGVMDGDFNFNSGWPIGLHANPDFTSPQLPGVDLRNIDQAAEDQIKTFIGSFETDEQHITQLTTIEGSAQTYMSAVSPWFFTHFPVTSFDKSFSFDGDEHLWVTRWENIIANRDRVSLVEIVTWNDFGESHYIGPLHPNEAPAESVEWVTGFDHQAWLNINNFFATQFRTGTAPPIERDQLVMWARPHPKAATPTNDTLPVTDSQLFQDKLWAVLLATADGELTLATSDTTSQTFPVTAGVNKLSLALTPDGFMRGTLVRNGQTAIDLRPDGYTFNPTPEKLNFNAFVASATSS